jgi:ribose transport system permease protein
MQARLLKILHARTSRQGLWILPLVMAMTISAALAILTKEFAGTENLTNLVAQAMPLIITAIGQMFVIVIGGLDLSVGSVVSFTTAILSLNASTYVLIPAVFLSAALIGLTNGVVITRFNVHPIIATLAMQYIVLGITRVLRPVSGGTVPDIVIQSVKGSILGISMPMIWGVVVVLIAWKLLHASRFGLHLFAIGGELLQALKMPPETSAYRFVAISFLPMWHVHVLQLLPGCFLRAALSPVIQTSGCCLNSMPLRLLRSVARSCRAALAVCMAQ